MIQVKNIWERALAAAVVPLLSLSIAGAQVQVRTSYGTIEGSSSRGIAAFKGVPFATPPIGDLRWRPPLPPASWDGVRKTDAFGASCMQLKAGERLPWTSEFMVQNQISEDCLYLNIWTPRADASARLPVIVFLHGGGFREGSGAIDVYRGENLAEKGAVVVTINYRLGVFGFFAHPELTAESEHHASGNYGLLDQIAALQWVHTNIPWFGGDPHRVTIWGQSAGAFSVAALVASPLTAGLFQRAQADSGLGVTGIPMRHLREAQENGIKFAAEHHASSLKELRALSAEALLPDAKAVAASISFAPIEDGWLLSDTPSEMNVKGNDNDVPFITGYQADDAALFFPPVHALDEYHAMIQNRYGEMAAEFERLYPVATIDDIKKAMTRSGQDRNRVSMFVWAAERGKSHRQPVFTYYFDRAIPWPQHPEFGAFHSGELPYFFLNLGVLHRPWEKEDFTLATSVSSYLVNFAAKGDPNGTGLASWPAVDPGRQETMELGAECGPMPLADKGKTEFWMRYFNSPAIRNATPF